MRLDHVDGLRGLAVLGVLVAHAAIWSGFNHEAGSTSEGALIDLGTAGVDLFFVISGFCMFWPRLRPDGVRPLKIRHFFVGRIRRIVPPYLLAIALVIAGSWIMWRHGGGSYWGGPAGGMQSVFPSSATDLAGDVLAHVTFLHGLIPVYGRTIDGAFWSLSTEWQFYLLLPVLVLAARRWGIAPVIGGALAIAAAWTLFLQSNGVQWPNHTFTDPILYRLTEFAAGMGVAVLVKRERRVPLVHLAAVVSLGAAAWLQTHGGSLWQTPLWAMGFGAVTYLGARRGLVQSLLTARPLRWVGRISYSLYLIHGVVFMLLATVSSQFTLSLHLRLAIFEVIGIPLAVIAARALFIAAELPSVRWSHRGRAPSQTPPNDEGGNSLSTLMPSTPTSTREPEPAR